MPTGTRFVETAARQIQGVIRDHYGYTVEFHVAEQMVELKIEALMDSLGLSRAAAIRMMSNGGGLEAFVLNTFEPCKLQQPGLHLNQLEATFPVPSDALPRLLHALAMASSISFGASDTIGAGECSMVLHSFAAAFDADPTNVVVPPAAMHRLAARLDDAADLVRSGMYTTEPATDLSGLAEQLEQDRDQVLGLISGFPLSKQRM